MFLNQALEKRIASAAPYADETQSVLISHVRTQQFLKIIRAERLAATYIRDERFFDESAETNNQIFDVRTLQV